MLYWQSNKKEKKGIHDNMRKETSKIVQALLNGKPATAARTHTDGTSLFLHGNKIATLERYPFGGTKSVTMTLAGWGTPTTRERLNGLLQSLAHRIGGQPTLAHFSQQKGKQFFTDVNGNKKEVDTFEEITIKCY